MNHVKAKALNLKLFAALCDDKALISSYCMPTVIKGENPVKQKGKLVTIVPRCGLASQASLFD